MAGETNGVTAPLALDFFDSSALGAPFEFTWPEGAAPQDAGAKGSANAKLFLIGLAAAGVFLLAMPSGRRRR